MRRDFFGWHTHRLPCPARVLRWGHWGTPVLLFPTAGGDFEEPERQGLIGALAGLIVGGMDRMNDNEIPFGKTAKEIISEAVKEYKYPVCFDFPAGHGEVNLALVLGKEIRVQIDTSVEIEL